MESLQEVFKKTISFLDNQEFDYLVIGGIASSVMGYPRMTGDVDICIFIKKSLVRDFLQRAKKDGFTFNEKEMIKKTKETGTFRISLGEFHVDFLILSTDFEKTALSRKQRVNIYGIDAPLPTPEDLILFKIIPARHIDLADAENIAKRHSGKLDKIYLEKWAMKLSDETENMRIYNEVKRLLKL